MMGLNDIDAAEIMGILVIAILLISFVWRLYIGDDARWARGTIRAVRMAGTRHRRPAQGGPHHGNRARMR